MTDAVQVALPPKLIPVFAGRADVRGAFGGRGSGKTRSFAKMAAVQGYIFGNAGQTGIILCARQFMNSLEDSSLEEVKRAIEDEPFLLDYYEVGEKYIRSKDGRISFSFSGLDRSIASVKSKGRLLLCWVDEAEPVTEEAWQTLIPTLREEGDGWNAELWVTWNPRRKNAAVEARFRFSSDPLVKVVELNWVDNPMFPAKLERDRQRDLAERPDQYDHIWGGAYVSAIVGAYYAKQLIKAKEERRITNVAPDPLLTFRAFVDIGGTGAKADAFVMWIAQFVGKEIRAIDYYEAVGQPLETHLQWLRERKYGPGSLEFWLPHDGAAHDKVFNVSYESSLQSAGYTVTVVPNQGRGAAGARIESGRRMFPSIWFNQPKVQPGIDALGWYHEKRDEVRAIGLGPDHDWASHGCFHGDTKVLTRYGTRRIMELPNTGEVLTPCGWKQYINPRMTKRAAQLVEVVFTSGYSVKCTPDHLFLTESGWKSAESLMPDTLILSSLTRSRNISEALFTAFGRATATFQKAAAVCIEMFGRLLLGRYQRTATFTTEMAMSQTTGWKTWNVSTQMNICELSGKKILSMGAVSLATWLGRRLPSGIHLPKAVSGIEDMQSGLKVGQSGGESQRNAQSATLNSLLSFAKAEIHRCIAVARARFPLTASEGSRTNGLLRIENVNRLNETADVWDITVPDGHMFSLENGAVVHNSDAFGLMCVVAENTINNSGWGGALKYPHLGTR